MTPPRHAPALLAADRIDLRVLAPAAYYVPFRLTELERSVEAGARALGDANGVAMTFGFDVLPGGLLDGPASNVSLMEGLAERRRLETGN